MFNYTHELIINSLAGTIKASDVNNTTIYDAAGVASEGTSRLATYEDPAISGVVHVLIERGGDYRGDLIFPRGAGVVFKSLPFDGRLSTATFTVPSVTAGTVLNLSMFVKLLDPAAIAEYAYPNWASFGKPVMVGVTATGVAADDAAKLAKALKDAIPYNNKFVTVEVDDDELVLTASEFGLEFTDVRLEKLVEGECDPCAPDKYVPVDGFSAEIVKTVVPFGTADKLVENYRFPTYGNRRYAALNSDETPIPGSKYIMYSFSYDSPRPGLGGLSGVGQRMDAVTRHIYWVNDALAAGFDAALTAANVQIVEKQTVPDTVEDSSSSN